MQNVLLRHLPRWRAANIPLHLVSSFLPQGLDIFASPSRAHGANVIWVELSLDRPYGGGISRDNDGAAALSSGQGRSDGDRCVNVVVLVIGRGRGRVDPLNRRRLLNPGVSHITCLFLVYVFMFL